MLMINTENTFFEIFLYFLQVLSPKKAFGDKNISFFFFLYPLNIVSNKDFKKLSSKRLCKRILLEN